MLAYGQFPRLDSKKWRIEIMSRYARFVPIDVAAVATATALLCVVLSVTTPAGARGGGSNPPWFPSLMAFEHYDSGRTKLFEQAHFTGSAHRAARVRVMLSCHPLSLASFPGNICVAFPAPPAPHPPPHTGFYGGEGSQ